MELVGPLNPTPCLTEKCFQRWQQLCMSNNSVDGSVQPSNLLPRATLIRVMLYWLSLKGISPDGTCKARPYEMEVGVTFLYWTPCNKWSHSLVSVRSEQILLKVNNSKVHLNTTWWHTTRPSTPWQYNQVNTGVCSQILLGAESFSIGVILGMLHAVPVKVVLIHTVAAILIQEVGQAVFVLWQY